MLLKNFKTQKNNFYIFPKKNLVKKHHSNKFQKDQTRNMAL
ncbi:Hypothetical Protein SLY_0091 [Strawberry lethal yellows phytoplasma (CPA) str. NZSb11]|uniref:Uncharacterized protein n=1 Tax=Strawberry lethal yellows phytoplasma (CPA) str. NZSb11 TaxID=980422 RepID=R4RW01_PHYAS|nr:Hypothetical Protein SLY_0091 [Strawberry lethal yellows phytoplasma (CPA) str. NZSb11]